MWQCRLVGWFLLSKQHTQKLLANTVLCAQLQGEDWVYTLMSTYTSLLPGTQIHTKNASTDPYLSVVPTYRKQKKQMQALAPHGRRPF